ncbi:Metallo-beta-lactamase domain protein [Pleurostoma richardsiae]|uniref:Metallo-beta-lactamase domain protein n=1 Tax=Pleurostoma richardsiae TaxID=41990 RepID=A0AA38S5E7_9PEZI|nr:Metallo-beta-lactamase domain protein [Pleurostoma richardsiae]
MVLQYKVFFSKRLGVTRSTPPGNENLKWVPTTSTLIYGETDAVLVDTQLTAAASQELSDWVIAARKNVTAIYITHAHADHFYGSSALLERFPDAKVVSTSEIVVKMTEEISRENGEGLWATLFPGQIPEVLVAAIALDNDEFELEGEKLVVVRTGHTDTDDTTTLWVPSISLAVTGDAVYNNTHPFLGESRGKQARLEWIAALDKIAALKPTAVVGGHSDPSRDFSPGAIEQTKLYLEDFDRLAEQTTTAKELYDRMLELHPGRLNVGSLWGGASLVKG